MPSHIQSIFPDAKLLELRRLIRAGRTIDCAQVVIVEWPQPTGTRYYAKTRYDLAPNFQGIPWTPIEYRILNSRPDGAPEAIPLNSSYEVGNDTISLELIEIGRAHV